MTFDWSQIAYIGSPLVVPFWAAMNIIGGLVVVMWFIAPIMCTSIPDIKTPVAYVFHRLLQRHVLLVHANSLRGCF
jgi:hypothetical protein